MVATAAKMFRAEKPAEAVSVEATLLRALHWQGLANVADALEYSSPWMSRFMAGEMTLNLEGICRLLAAAGLRVSDGKGEEQLLVDELAAAALRRVSDQLSRIRPDEAGNVLLTDEEFTHLLQLAQYGARVLFAKIDTASECRSGNHIRSVA